MPQSYATIDVRTYTDRSYEALYDAFEWDLPETYNIAAEIIESHAGSGRTALRFEWQDGTRTTYTFADIDDRAGRLAAWFRDRGVARGDRLGVALSQHPVTLITHLAAYKLGAIIVPMSVLFGTESVAYRVDAAAVSTLVTDGAFAETMAAELEGIDTLVTVDASPRGTRYADILAETDEVVTAVDTAPDDPCLILFTSGTTGDPKGVVHTHGCLAGFLPGFELMNEFPSDDAIVFTPADWAWVAGSLDTAFPAWWGGRTVVGYESQGFEPETVFDVLASHGVTHTLLTPTMLRLMSDAVADPQAGYDLDLEVIVTGGEPTAEAVFDWVDDGFDDVVLNEHYGQTEADILLVNSHSAMSTIEQGSLGRPAPGHEVVVLDEDGEPLPDGEIGQIAVRMPDPVVTQGYWNDEASTAAAYHDDYWLTGDMGYRDAEGTFWFAGRADDLIISSGYRVSPTEVERTLEDQAPVQAAVVFSTPHATRGDVITAAVKLTDGTDGTTDLKQRLQDTVRDELAKYKYPRRITFVESFPTTSTGKVSRQDIRERFESLTAENSL